MPLDRACLFEKLRKLYPVTADVRTLYCSVPGAEPDAIVWEKPARTVWNMILADAFHEDQVIEALVDAVSATRAGDAESLRKCTCSSAPRASAVAPRPSVAMRRVTAHLECDRASQWQFLSQLLGERGSRQAAATGADVLLLWGQEDEGHEYFIGRVREQSPTLSATLLELKPPLPATAPGLEDAVVKLLDSSRPATDAHLLLGQALSRSHILMVAPPVAIDNPSDRRHASQYSIPLLGSLARAPTATKVAGSAPPGRRFVVLQPITWRTNLLSFLRWFDPEHLVGEFAEALRKAPSGPIRVHRPEPLKPLDRDHVTQLLGLYFDNPRDMVDRVLLHASTSKDVFAALEQVFEVYR